MARYITASDELVALNGTIPFNVVSVPCSAGNVIPIIEGALTLRGNTPNKFARYEVTVQGNIQIPTGGAITPIAIGISVEGVTAPESVAIITPAAAGQYQNINITFPVTVPAGCCIAASARYVDGTEDDATTTPTPSIKVRRGASITVKRIA